MKLNSRKWAGGKVISYIYVTVCRPYIKHFETNTDLFLSLSERQIFQLASTEAQSVGEFHKVACRVRAGTENEYDRTQRRASLEDGLEADDWRHDVLFAHHPGHILADGTVDAVHAKTAE